MTDPQKEAEKAEKKDESEKAGRARRQGRAYQGAFEAVFSILIAAGIGYAADARFETAPRYLLVGIVIGFAAFVLRLVRLGSELHEDTGADAENPERTERK